jgi:hypothetical protein
MIFMEKMKTSFGDTSGFRVVEGDELQLNGSIFKALPGTQNDPSTSGSTGGGGGSSSGVDDTHYSPIREL